jgi:predicted pyridoxine 5'-phosphate oxidase superfamily flavin-nucleotide-binding protein
MTGFLDIAVTPSVRAAQLAAGVAHPPFAREADRFTEAEAAFIATRDSFYLATVSETGWPYVQHRGGPPGFLKILDDRTLAFADYRGNRQYLSVGNLGASDRVCLFLMDYPRRARLKIYATAEIFAPEPPTPGYRALPERMIRLHLQAFDWNCPQHITPRYTQAELAPLAERLAQLEAENAALKARLAEENR